MKFDIGRFKYEFTQNQASNEEIHENILEGMNVHGSNFIILMCAIFIACIGLNMNSVAVIIGAMLISPLMGSIIGIGYGVGTYNFQLLKEAFKILLISIVISLITSTLYFSLTPINTAGSEILARTSPTIWDVLIAFLGGIAGIIGITRNKSSNVIPGVAIATALMPPLCTAGFGLATKRFDIFLGAGYLFFINGFFISISTFIVTKALNLPVRQNINDEGEHGVKRIILIASIIVIIPSMISAIGLIRNTIIEKNLNEFISKELKQQYVLSKDINNKKDTITLVTVGETITQKDMDTLVDKLKYYDLDDKKLVIKQDDSDISNLEKYINNINSKNISTREIKSIENNNSINIDIKSISKEVKSIYPDIKSIKIGFVNDEISQESKKGSNTPIMIVYTTNNKLDENLPRLENWFKARLNVDKVIVCIQRSEEVK